MQVYFAVENPSDSIQRHHVAGAFYEAEELAIIQRYFPIGGRFLDIGANVGNHSLYVALFMHAELIVPVEPHDRAVRILLSNLVLNQLEGRADLNWLGYGVGRSTEEGFGINWHKRNLGGGRLKAGSGDIPLVSGAEIIGDREFDLIKIDVEGMELDVLEGLMPAFATHRPVLFVEVEDRNVSEFKAFLDRAGYDIAETFKRHRRVGNFLAVPKGLPQETDPLVSEDVAS